MTTEATTQLPQTDRVEHGVENDTHEVAMLQAYEHLRQQNIEITRDLKELSGKVDVKYRVFQELQQLKTSLRDTTDDTPLDVETFKGLVLRALSDTGEVHEKNGTTDDSLEVAVEDQQPRDLSKEALRERIEHQARNRNMLRQQIRELKNQLNRLIWRQERVDCMLEDLYLLKPLGLPSDKQHLTAGLMRALSTHITYTGKAFFDSSKRCNCEGCEYIRSLE